MLDLRPRGLLDGMGLGISMVASVGIVIVLVIVFKGGANGLDQNIDTLFVVMLLLIVLWLAGYGLVRLGRKRYAGRA